MNEMKKYIEYIDNEHYKVSEQEINDVLELNEMEWVSYYNSLPNKEYYIWDKQDEREWKNHKEQRMELVKEEIKWWNNYIQTIESSFLKKLYQPINEDEICLELVDVEGSRANQLLTSYFMRKRKEVKS